MEQLLSHRKESHNKTKKFMCRDFKKGSCKFTSEECWYSHEDEDVSVEEGMEGGGD